MADATQVQRRRGTQSQCEAGTPVEGEIWVDTTFDTLRVGDGAKAGGYIMPNGKNLQESRFNYATATGTNDLSVNLFPVPDEPSDGFSFKFKAAENNTDIVNLIVNGHPQVELRKIQGSSIVSLSPNDIIASGVYEVNHNGTYYLLSSPIPVVRNDLEFVGRFEPNSSSVNFELLNIFDVGYNYEIDFVGIGLSTNANVQCRAQFSADGGASWLNSYGVTSTINAIALAPFNVSATAASGRSFSKFLLNDPAENTSVRIHSLEYSIGGSSTGYITDRNLIRMGGPSSLIGVNSIRIGPVSGFAGISHGYANVWRKRAS